MSNVQIPKHVKCAKFIYIYVYVFLFQGFENSSLKTSFSLSSLPASATTPEKTVKPRQFNSLTKNRIKATAVRRSWGSTASDHREEFWSVLQANYNYIMDNQLIDNCHVNTLLK